jgi:hypothetical protein
LAQADLGKGQDKSNAQRADVSDVSDVSDVLDIPLGLLVNARSGDKGGSANVGIWVATPDAWEWMRTAITKEVLVELLPEASSLVVDRYELPSLRALNFVIHGLLDGGATEARRFDKQAKALGEWLRSRRVPVPAHLVPTDWSDLRRA